VLPSAISAVLRVARWELMKRYELNERRRVVKRPAFIPEQHHRKADQHYEVHFQQQRLREYLMTAIRDGGRG
jgi:hypothetical protein